jgi:hypothetical protein
MAANMPNAYFNRSQARRGNWLSGVLAVLVALALFGSASSVFAASNYGDCTYGSANYGGDCSTPPAAPTTPSGGGGLIFGSGPLAPGYQVGSAVATSTVAIPSTTSAVSSSSLSASQSVPEAATSTLPSTDLLSATSAGAVYLRQNRQLNDRGADIRSLQKVLNANGFVVAESGPGSAGNETSIFGIHTYRALIEFQSAHGLPATGFLGPLTRAIINGLSGVEK